MARRVLSTFLWFYATWYLGATIALYLNVSSALGPILGITAGAIVALDPLGAIWSRRTVEPSAPAAPSIESALLSEG